MLTKVRLFLILVVCLFSWSDIASAQSLDDEQLLAREALDLVAVSS
jgi:hypothetical protein